MFNLDDCLAFITSKSSKLFADTLEHAFRPYHLTRSQWIAIYFIYNDGHMTQRELADKIGIKEPSVVRLIQKLEYDGYLTRHGLDEDKRVKQVELTTKGEQAYHELLPVVKQFKNKTIAGIAEEDLKTFKNVLEAMLKNTTES